MNIPEGFVLVPASMLLEKDVIELVAGHCGDGDQMFGDYTDGRLWIGDLEGDDGEKTHGLHIMTDEYPEEGSSTLVEFPRAELPAYDEAAELAACRAHWEKNPNCLFSDMWLGWKACAQSRDGSVSDE